MVTKATKRKTQEHNKYKQADNNVQTKPVVVRPKKRINCVTQTNRKNNQNQIGFSWRLEKQQLT